MLLLEGRRNTLLSSGFTIFSPLLHKWATNKKAPSAPTRCFLLIKTLLKTLLIWVKPGKLTKVVVVVVFIKRSSWKSLLEPRGICSNKNLFKPAVASLKLTPRLTKYVCSADVNWNQIESSRKCSVGMSSTKSVYLSLKELEKSQCRRKKDRKRKVWKQSKL